MDDQKEIHLTGAGDEGILLEDVSMVISSVTLKAKDRLLIP
jgi:hypothetical protein